MNCLRQLLSNFFVSFFKIKRELGVANTPATTSCNAIRFRSSLRPNGSLPFPASLCSLVTNTKVGAGALRCAIHRPPLKRFACMEWDNA